MIADDLVTFVKADLSSFSFAVVLLIIFALGLIFRKLRWIALPLACCAVAGVIMVGVLGLMDWRVTVVSSNFISLLLIITISLTVHLIVRYRELRATRHYTNHDKLLRHSVLSMFRPLSVHGTHYSGSVWLADSQWHSSYYYFWLDDDDGSGNGSARCVHLVSGDSKHYQER